MRCRLHLRLPLLWLQRACAEAYALMLQVSGVEGRSSGPLRMVLLCKAWVARRVQQ